MTTNHSPERQAGPTTILVTGATGRVGRNVAGQLARAGQHVRALTRSPGKASLPFGVEVVAGDLLVPETLKSALDGATGLYLISMGGDDYAPLPTGPEIVERAVEAGVRRIAVLTGTDDELAVLDAVQASGVEWTHLRPVEFMSNKLEWAPSIRSEGVVRAAFGDKPHAIVHEADIAAIAVTALLEPGHHGMTYRPTGPEALTPIEATRIMGEILDQQIKFVELSMEEAREELRTAGISDDVADFVLDYNANPPPEASTVVPTVEDVTGRAPRHFAQWVAEHADAFR